MDTVIKLIAENPAQRPDGTWTAEPAAREVFAKVQSVTRSEFFGAGRVGLNPAYRFVVFSGDYHGETVVEYNGQNYAVYRTHQSDSNTYITDGLRARQELMQDYIELYAQREGGVIGQSNDGP